MQIKTDTLIWQHMLRCRKDISILSFSYSCIAFAAENGTLSSAIAKEAKMPACIFAWPCSMAPSLPDSLVHPPVVSNLLWFSKSCTRQFEWLPFSREALHWVILRNPHLRLICMTKTSFHKFSCQTESDFYALNTKRQSSSLLSSRPPLCHLSNQ